MTTKETIWKGIDAVIFDMDGLLVDSEPVHLRTLNAVLADYGHEVDQKENDGYIGQPEIETWRMVSEKRGMHEDLATLSRRRSEAFARLLQTEGLPPTPGSMELVRACKAARYPIAIASSTPREGILEVLGASGFDKEFEILVSAYDPEVKRGKPFPDVFLRAAELIETDPEKCLVFEDSGPGIRAAKAAGMKCVTVPGSHVPMEDRNAADLVLGSLTDMPTPPVRAWVGRS